MLDHLTRVTLVDRVEGKPLPKEDCWVDQVILDITTTMEGYITTAPLNVKALTFRSGGSKSDAVVRAACRRRGIVVVWAEPPDFVRRLDGDVYGCKTYPQPKDGWVCFHCGERFKKPGLARDHFGEVPGGAAQCERGKEAARVFLGAITNAGIGGATPPWHSWEICVLCCGHLDHRDDCPLQVFREAMGLMDEKRG